jgi:hypothetical protein
MARARGRRPRVILNCVADSYAGSDERIVEFSDDETGLGGLICLRRVDGRLRLEVYRCDDGVEVVACDNVLVRGGLAHV